MSDETLTTPRPRRTGFSARPERIGDLQRARPIQSTPSVRTAPVLGALMLGAFAYGVLAAIMVPALPFFESSLHTNESGVTWLLTAFFLSAAGSTAIIGRLGDIYGKRRMLLIALGFLAVGTLLSALSNSLGLEIAGRALQGAAGGLFPLAFGIVRDELPQERVAAGISALAVTISLGSAAVVLPGLLIHHVNWHWLFWIPLILTLGALLSTWRFVRESPIKAGGSINWINAALMMLGITAVVFGISEGSVWGWSSGKMLSVLIGGLAVCGIWLTAELRSKNPVINMTLMRQRGVWTTNVFAVMAGAGLYGFFANYPIFAQLPASTGFSYGASILQSGLYILPFAVTLGVATALARHLVDASSPVHVLSGGSLLTAAGFGFMASWHSHPIDMMISLGVVGAGLGIVLATLFTAVVQAVPAKNVGEVSGMNTVIRFIGGAAGTQVITLIITSNTSNGVPGLHGFVISFIVLAGFMVAAAIVGLMVPSAARNG